MNAAQAFHHHREFLILQTTPRTQTAVMELLPGGASGESPESHPHSDQVVLILEGTLTAEVGNETTIFPPGTSLIIPAGTPHRLKNDGHENVNLYTTYSPPAYPEDEESD